MRHSRPGLRLRFRLALELSGPKIGITVLTSYPPRCGSCEPAPLLVHAMVMVSVAAGPNLDIGKLGLERSIDFISDEGKVDIDTSAIALGGHAGILFSLWIT